MALSNAVEEVGSMIQNLVLFLRYATKSGEYVTFGQEVKHLETYIEIQKVRFGSRFQINFDIGKDLYEHKILKLTHQPLIENAIFHGLEQKPGKGVIKVRAYMESKDVVIKVMDNGMGIEPEKLELLSRALCSGCDCDFKREGQGIGIINIQKRIRMYYGDGYGLSVKSRINLGTVFILRIPAAGGEKINVQSTDCR
jgi:sensor histidine kinase YesM